MVCWPNGLLTRPTITTGFGGYPGHYGCDFKDFDNNCAVLPGTVTYAAFNASGAGLEVKIDHGGGIVTRYLHNAALWVVVGQVVASGVVVGLQGSTGNSTGKHLHFEVLVGGVKVDPVPWLAARIARPASVVSVPLTVPIASEIHMKTGQIHYTKNGKVIRALYTTGTGYFIPFEANDAAIANGFASSLATGSSVQVTESLFNAMKVAAATLAPK